MSNENKTDNTNCGVAIQLKTKSNENEQNTTTSDSRDEFHQFNVAQKKSCPRVQTTQIPFIELHKQVQLT